MVASQVGFALSASCATEPVWSALMCHASCSFLRRLTCGESCGRGELCPAASSTTAATNVVFAFFYVNRSIQIGTAMASEPCRSTIGRIKVSCRKASSKSMALLGMTMSLVQVAPAQQFSDGTNLIGTQLRLFVKLSRDL